MKKLYLLLTVFLTVFIIISGKPVNETGLLSGVIQ